MKIKIKKCEFSEYYFLSLYTGPGKEVELSTGMVQELMKFQKLAEDVQKLLNVFYEGKTTPQSRIKRMVEEINASHNRRPD